jgi:hypothetical protein
VQRCFDQSSFLVKVASWTLPKRCASLKLWVCLWPSLQDMLREIFHSKRCAELIWIVCRRKCVNWLGSKITSWGVDEPQLSSVLRMPYVNTFIFRKTCMLMFPRNTDAVEIVCPLWDQDSASALLFSEDLGSQRSRLPTSVSKEMGPLKA